MDEMNKTQTGEALSLEEPGEILAPESETPPKKKRFGGLKKKLKLKWIIIGVVILAIVIFALRSCAGPAKVVTQEYTEDLASRRQITQSLTGSGTLQAADSYVVTTLTAGELIYADFEEGDIVKKDDILYKIDSSDASKNIERAQLSLSQSQRAYDNAVDASIVESPISGSVYSLSVDVGDEVTMGQTLAVIREGSTMSLVVPFPADDTAKFYVGQTASVTLDGSFETLTGTITKISGSDNVLAGNRIVRNVTIEVANRGAMTSTQTATATINGIGCTASGTFTYKAERTVTATAAGTVTAVNVKEGNSISKNQVILTLGGDTLNDQIKSAQEGVRNAQLSLESQQDILDNYTIESPIDGTIVEKNYKLGDKTETGKQLCSIYDLSYLKMTMSIDELDISKVSVGQTVKITADAVEGKSYEGIITKVSVAGVTVNGTTSYPVTVQIDETEGLLPGMNVDAEIVIANADDALSIPSEAVERDNKVLVTAASPSAANKLDDTAPEGYVYVSVQTGISDDDYIEILGGLEEGDTVAYIKSVAQGTDLMSMMMGMESEDMSSAEAGSSGHGGPGGSGGGPGSGGNQG